MLPLLFYKQYCRGYLLYNLFCLGKFTYSYKRALCYCLSFYVCQMFEQSADGMSVERTNTFKDFSSFLLVGMIYKMACAAYNCLRRCFCVEFCCGTCKYQLCKSAHLEKQERICVFVSHGTYHCGWSKQLSDTKTSSREPF